MKEGGLCEYITDYTNFFNGEFNNRAISKGIKDLTHYHLQEKSNTRIQGRFFLHQLCSRACRGRGDIFWKFKHYLQNYPSYSAKYTLEIKVLPCIIMSIV